MSRDKFCIETAAGSILGSGVGWLAYSGHLEAAGIPAGSLGWAVTIGILTLLATYAAAEVLMFLLLDLFAA